MINQKSIYMSIYSSYVQGKQKKQKHSRNKCRFNMKPAATLKFSLSQQIVVWRELAHSFPRGHHSDVHKTITHSHGWERLFARSRGLFRHDLQMLWGRVSLRRATWTSNESLADRSFIKPDDYESSADDGFAERLMWLRGCRLLIIPCKSGGGHCSDWNRLDWPSVWLAWLPEWHSSRKCILGVTMLLCLKGLCLANLAVLIG